MSAQRHVIGKQIIDIRLRGGDKAFEVQQQMASCVRRVFIPALEDEFDTLTRESEVMQIDHLEIDLGFLHSDKLDHPNYLKELADRLRKKLQEAISGGNNDASTVSVELHGFEQWLFFMEQGRLPWPVVTLTKNWEQCVLETVAGSVRAMEQLKTLWQKSEDARARLIQQHTEKFLVSLLAAITGETQDLLPVLLTRLWKALHLIELGKRKNQTEITWREHCWQLLMQLVIGHGKKYAYQQLLAILMHRQMAVYSVVDNPLETVRTVFKESDYLMKVIFSAGENEVARALTEAQVLLAGKSAYLSQNNGVNHSGNGQAKSNQSVRPNEADEVKDSMVLTHAGVALIHVFLPHLFRNLDWVEDDIFRDEACRHRAIHLVHYIATGSTEAMEHQLALEKVLCGQPLHVPVPRYIRLKKEALDEAEEMLQVAINRWEALGHASPEGLREGFFAREGKLTDNDRGWTLQVEQNTLDVLLDKLPWNLSMIKLPWMNKLIHLVWR